MTLEYCKGHYKVHARSDDQVLAAGKRVEPGNAVDWLPGQMLEINGEHKLVLEVDGDSAPSPKPIESKSARDEDDVAAPGGFSKDPTVSGTMRKSKSYGKPLVITLVCLLALSALLLMDNPSSEPSTLAPSFSSIVQMSLKSAETPQILVQRLQFAQAALVRGNRELARQEFSALRDDLLQQVESFRASNREAEIAILEFVDFQLGNIQ